MEAPKLQDVFKMKVDTQLEDGIVFSFVLYSFLDDI